MKRCKRVLCVVLMALAVFSLGAAQSPDNLLTNTNFSKDADGNLSGWNEVSTSSLFSYTQDADNTPILVITNPDLGYGQLTQTVPCQTETIYRIAVTARVQDYSGDSGAYAQVLGVTGAFSESTVAEEWTTLEFYGYTSPEQESFEVGFVFGSEEHPTKGVAQFKDLVVEQVDDVPDGARYVWMYDRQAYLAEHEEQQQEENDQAGMVASFLIAGVFLLLVAFLNWQGAFRPRPLEQEGGKRIYFGVLLALAVGVIFACTTYGHSTDMTNFSAWAAKAADVGLSDFYISGIWADYPPGYIYVLYLMGSLAKLFGFSVGSVGFNLLMKLPALLCDAATALLVYRMSKKALGNRSAANLGLLMAWNPMVLLDSAIWGQMDGILTLLVLISLWSFMTKKKELCAASFILGVLVKPQMLVFGPLLFFGFLKDIFSKNWVDGLLRLLTSILAAVATFVLVILPFTLKQDPMWIVDKFTSAAGLYPYATVNAYNLYALFGANWAPVDNEFFLGITYEQFGIASIVLVCLAAGIFYWRAKRREAIFPCAAFTMWGIFLLAHTMHERYLFPAILLLAVAYLYYRDKRLLNLFGIASVGVFLNSTICLLDSQIPSDSPLILLISGINLVGFLYMAKVCFDLTVRNKRVEWSEAEQDETEQRHIPRTEQPLKLFHQDPQGRGIVRKDLYIMLAITLIYGIFSLFNLGATNVPDSYWRPMQAEEGAIVELEDATEISYIYYYPGVGKGKMEIDLSLDHVLYDKQFQATVEEGNMYTWQTLQTPGQAKYIRIISHDAGLMINELAIYDAQGNRVTPKSVTAITESGSSDVSALFDEQDLVVENPSYFTEMYFDEIYHARTAFEHLHGMAPYENSHPPLGKIFIMLGIAVFGMNPFGWRIVGALFGIGMLPLLYVFAKRIFKSTKYATIACLLFALDGMHFVQTRIATIDVYGVFFIIAMCYFMYRYYHMNFYEDSLKKTFVPLGLSGVMFGLGCASKWIGFYAGAGLAVAFFVTLYKRYREYQHAKLRLEHAQGEELALCQRVVESFWKNTLKTLLFCIVFFILVPVAIYLLSYLPYFLCTEKPYDLQGVWGVQEFMFSYHSNLTATHPYQSSWYSWPVIGRPIWYYQGTGLEEGMMSSIACFGNPIIWWGGLIAVFWAAYMLLKKDEKIERSSLCYLFICLGAAYLPWVLITRATFIYHYFASVPFIILLLTALMKRHFEGKKWLIILFFVIAVVMFCMFYPVWSGLVISRDWALQFLQWFPSWWFF